AAIIQGRMVVVRQEESITVPANSSGYIALTVDLTQEVIPGSILPESEEYEWTNNQVKLEFITKVIKGNLNNGDKVY
ncbi:TPA: hypothetical protein LY451_003104, partial [Enterococcus faecium]|nr:hypothetical protein [Enterococcus faecium]